MYFFAAIIGFLLSYFSFKLYNFTRKRYHLFLNLSFIFITIGFSILAASNIYSFLHFERCQPNCIITNQNVFNWILYGNYGYYLFSIIGYFMFILSYPLYRKKGESKFFLEFIPAFTINIFFQPQQTFVLYPFENAFFQPFHILSALFLLLIVLRTFANYKKAKLKNCSLIPLGFAAMLFYHVLMFSVPFSPLFFAFAHLSLLIGFTSLLLMLAKVTRK